MSHTGILKVAANGTSTVRFSLRLSSVRRTMRTVQESMKQLGFIVVPLLVSACGVQVRAETPPPPVVTVDVAAQPPPEPAAPAGATVNVDVEPVPQGNPEEVQATTEPPDPVYEEQTDSPNVGYVWVGGYWGWNGVDWGWSWGRWAQPPEGQIYIEPYYERVGGRVVYVQGSWGAPDAPRRSYGGERIQFTAAVRPANYHRGEHVVVEHRAGPLPGKRPGGAYVKATGTVRPLPTATAPAHRVASTHDTVAPRSEPNKEPLNARGAATAHEGATGHEPTPAHGATTPAHEAATPAHEPVTPAHEAATPAHEPVTPAHGGITAREAATAHETNTGEAPKKDVAAETAAHAPPPASHAAPPPAQPKRPAPAPPPKKKK